ncbi:hypothetical protein Tco_0139832 [Tanacetum coccineum]
MPPRIRTRSAGRHAAKSLRGGTGERVGRGGRGRRPREGNDERIDEFNGQGNDQGIGANGGVEGFNGNVEGANGGDNVRNVLVNGNRVGCSYKEFLACSPKEYDGKGGAIVLTHWIEKMESVHDMSGCSVDQKVKYTAGSFVGKALTHEMQKLESELWNHIMVGAGHAAYTHRFYELARFGINKWYQSFVLRNFDLEDMELESKNSSPTAKLPILMAFSYSEVYTDKTCSKTCLKNYKTLKKQCDDLLVKLNESEFKASTYKRGLATLEDQIITYKKNEVLFSEEIGVLKRDVACKDYEINVLKSEFEKIKQEKDGIYFKIEKFDKVPKDLDQLLGSQITDKSKKGLGYNALDLSYSGLDEFKEPEFKGYGPENSKQESNVVCDKEFDNSKENTDESLVEEQVSQDKNSFVESLPNVDKETIFPVNKKVEFTKPENHEKPVKKSIRYAEMYRSQSPRGNQRNWNGQKSNQLGKDFVMYNKACFICGSFNHLQINCHNHQRRGIVSRNNYNRVDDKNTYPTVLRNMSPKAVLLKTGLTPLNTVRPVNIAHPKTAVHSTFGLRAKDNSRWVPDFMEENEIEDSVDVDSSGKEKNLEDPFNIYKLLKKKKDTTENEINSEQTMKYPPGFTPKEGSEEIGMYAEESKSVNFVNLSDHKAEEANKDGHGNCVNKNSKEDVFKFGFIVVAQDKLWDTRWTGVCRIVRDIDPGEIRKIGKWKGRGGSLMGDFKEMEGFNKIMEDALGGRPCDKDYCDVKYVMKLKFLKAIFRNGYFSLFYADDAVFMGKWCDGNISTLIHVLECFYRASGLRINMSKSKILGVNVDSDKVKGAALMLRMFLFSNSLYHILDESGGSSLGFMHGRRFYTQNTLLWVRVVKAIHEDDGNVGGHVKSGAKSCWLDIVRETHALKTKDGNGTWRAREIFLLRRGIDIDSIMCAICDNGVETSRHLFFYCCMVRQIIHKITRWWDVPYVEVESYEDWYNWLVNLRISSMHKQMFEGIDVMRRLVGTIGLKTRILSLCNC